MNSPNIIAIGGGSLGLGETFEIDRIFVERTEKQNPKMLFIPTASDDDADYVTIFESIYAKRLGCEVSVLRLHSGKYDIGLIDDCDAIYVGGGNTKMMIAMWKSLGVADAIKRVVNAGKPVGGLSAGAICWFRCGNSDWPQYEGIPDVNTARLDCLNLVDLTVCPHTKDEGFRLSEFRAMMKTEPGVGIGLDDGCAIHVLGDRYRILASQPDRVAHRIEWIDGELTERELMAEPTFRPLAEI